jgi:hypothetical protein
VIDPTRLADALAADRDVLESLAANGDISSITRPIDLHFKGARDAIEQLAGDVEGLSLRFVGFNVYEDGAWSVDLQMDGTTNFAPIEQLTRKAVEIEISHDVDYDGWGCVNQTGSKH